MISCFNLLTAVVLILLDIKSSTYKPFLISAISFILSPFLDSRCASSVPLKINGDCTSPNNTLVNLCVSICFGSSFFIQWKLSASLSSSVMRTCRKACFMSPHSATGKENSFLQVHSTVDSVMLHQSLNIRLMKGWNSLIWLRPHALF